MRLHEERRRVLRERSTAPPHQLMGAGLLVPAEPPSDPPRLRSELSRSWDRSWRHTAGRPRCTPMLTTVGAMGCQASGTGRRGPAQDAPKPGSICSPMLPSTCPVCPARGAPLEELRQDPCVASPRIRMGRRVEALKVVLEVVREAEQGAAPPVHAAGSGTQTRCAAPRGPCTCRRGDDIPGVHKTELPGLLRNRSVARGPRSPVHQSRLKAREEDLVVNDERLSRVRKRDDKCGHQAQGGGPPAPAPPGRPGTRRRGVVSCLHLLVHCSVGPGPRPASLGPWERNAPLNKLERWTSFGGEMSLLGSSVSLACFCVTSLADPRPQRPLGA